MTPPSAAGAPPVVVEGLRRTYGDRVALDGVSFALADRELFGLLGPNGGGKSTLFKILATLLPPSGGRASVFGHELPGAAARVRSLIGVVFQSPSLDGKLTVRENLLHQGHLYGLRGADLAGRIARNLEWLGLGDRAGERAETLSGGLKRRVELAKGLLHDPRLLLLDEPSTGLDPAARRDLWDRLAGLRDDHGVTSLVTTHLMEEAERCDRVGILDRGNLVGLGTPEALRAEVGGDVVTVVPAAGVDPAGLAERVGAIARAPARSVGGAVHVDCADAAPVVARVLADLGTELASVTVGHPTLEDVFLERTGRQFE